MITPDFKLSPSGFTGIYCCSEDKAAYRRVLRNIIFLVGEKHMTIFDETRLLNVSLNCNNKRQFQ